MQWLLTDLEFHAHVSSKGRWKGTEKTKLILHSILYHAALAGKVVQLIQLGQGHFAFCPR